MLKIQVNDTDVVDKTTLESIDYIAW